MILYLICYILRIEAVCMVPALAVALFCRELLAAAGFAAAILLALACSLLTYLFKVEKKEIGAREGLLCVALCWIAVSVFGALPFFLSGEIRNPVDCLFETVSGFTTTGASILRDIEALSTSMLYWRSFTHWLGGMGVLVFLLAVLPAAKGKNSLLFIMRAESPGPQVDKLVPRLHKTAQILYGIYIGLTIIMILLLLAGGMPFFDSLTTAFATAGTGGFAIKNDSMMSYSLYLQGVCTIFMALFGINFSMFYLLLMRQFSKVFRNEELRLYLGVMLGATGLITLNILSQYGNNPLKALHHAAFQVSSIMTTTGFASADFNQWPVFSKTLILLLMIFGACAGSTGGGVKSMRLLILIKSAKRNIQHMLHPRSISRVHIDGAPLDDDTIKSVHEFLLAYFLIGGASFLLLSIDGFSVETNLSATLACLNNIGPGLDAVGPVANYAALSNLSKTVLIFDMLVGRLEVFPMLMIFVPRAWRR